MVGWELICRIADSTVFETSVFLQSGIMVEISFLYEPGHSGRRGGWDSVERPFCVVTRMVVEGCETQDPEFAREISRDHKGAMFAVVDAAIRAEAARV